MNRKGHRISPRSSCREDHKCDKIKIDNGSFTEREGLSRTCRSIAKGVRMDFELRRAGGFTETETLGVLPKTPTQCQKRPQTHPHTLLELPMPV